MGVGWLYVGEAGAWVVVMGEGAQSLILPLVTRLWGGRDIHGPNQKISI